MKVAYTTLHVNNEFSNDQIISTHLNSFFQKSCPHTICLSINQPGLELHASRLTNFLLPRHQKLVYRATLMQKGRINPGFKLFLVNLPEFKRIKW